MPTPQHPVAQRTLSAFFKPAPERETITLSDTDDEDGPDVQIVAVVRPPGRAADPAFSKFTEEYRPSALKADPALIEKAGGVENVLYEMWQCLPLAKKQKYIMLAQQQAQERARALGHMRSAAPHRPAEMTAKQAQREREKLAKDAQKERVRREVRSAAGSYQFLRSASLWSGPEASCIRRSAGPRPKRCGTALQVLPQQANSGAQVSGRGFAADGRGRERGLG